MMTVAADQERYPPLGGPHKHRKVQGKALLFIGRVRFCSPVDDA